MSQQRGDWQTAKKAIHERGKHLLETGMWSDCRFVVGTEPTQQFVEGHKLFLAMSSPVFEAMFFGGLPEKDPVAILDVQPEAFKALLEYIYTDKINLSSFDQACELCYGAKKYMLPHLVKECTTYLWSDLYPKNACRAYEFAKLFEEPVLMQKCLEIFCSQTQEVLSESSFEDAELSTVMTIFKQEELNINSELELFNALSRYSQRDNPTSDNASPNENAGNNMQHRPCFKNALCKIRFLTLTPQQFAEGPAMSTLLSQQEKFAILMNISSGSTDTPMPNGFSTSTQSRRRKIPVSTPAVVAVASEVPTAMATAFALPASAAAFPIPSAFFTQPPAPAPPADALAPPAPPRPVASISIPLGVALGSAQLEGGAVVADHSRKMYCTRELLRFAECMNNSVLDCALSFSCNRNICIYGIQVPAQVRVDAVEIDDNRVQQSYANSTYNELLYAHLLDGDGSRLTYTHYTSRVSYGSLIDINFNRPIYIQKNKAYKVGVVLNKTGYYPTGTCPMFSSCNEINFSFSQGMDSVRDGMIRAIIFSAPSVENNALSP